MYQTNTTIQSRTGITVIEVLTSIVVALIGVFGVLALIPFSVKQSQAGLDSDASVAFARNAIAQFEIGGFRNPNSWTVYNANGNIGTYNPFAAGVADQNIQPEFAFLVMPEIYSIDPLGITEVGGDGSDATFPFNLINADANQVYPSELIIQPANLNLPFSTGSFNQALAQRMFRTDDDLQFELPEDDLAGPIQQFNAEGNRQSNGRISWSAIVVPVKDPDVDVGVGGRWSYRMFVLVYVDRKTSLAIDSDGDGEIELTDGEMTAARVDTSNATGLTGLQSPLGTIPLDLGVSSVESVVRRDDWVMLINRDPAETTSNPGFDRQVAFCRVLSVSDAEDTDNDGNVDVSATLTVDGPDFVFRQDTFIVHLRDVIGVYERSFTPEFESNWTPGN